MGVGFPQTEYLIRFGEMVLDAWGHMPYHVGSSLALKTGWRDVDVRLLMPDKEFAETFENENGTLNQRWAPTCMAWSALGEKITGLPIDFQIQKLSDANTKYRSADGCHRSTIGIVSHHWGSKRQSECDDAMVECLTAKKPDTPSFTVAVDGEAKTIPLNAKSRTMEP